MPAGDDFLRATLPALDLVHNLARRMVPGRADAEDLVQDLPAGLAGVDGRAATPPGRAMAGVGIAIGAEQL
jgi:hypothetical protein